MENITKTQNNFQVKVAMTGATGNMGRAAVSEILKLDYVYLRILVKNDKEQRKMVNSWRKTYGAQLDVVYGDIADIEPCLELVSGVDYVFNLAGVIPPTADKYHEDAYRCNYIGAQNIVRAISHEQNQPALVHISTVAIYGHRNYLHPWGRVGDPLLPSIYDSYAATKIKGEREVLDSELSKWAILRQTGILHEALLMDNISDGLMFHTCFNVPIEWVTAHDSGVLIRKIIERDTLGEVPEFWNKCYNIGGGDSCRITGYETFQNGFDIIGGSVESFMRPLWHSIRNFHCMWFEDSDDLQNLFHFQEDSVPAFWKQIAAKHKYYSLAKILPASLIRRMVIEPLLKDNNAPLRWVKEEDEGRIKAFFGCRDNIECMPTSWDDYSLICKGKIPNGDIDYQEMRDIKNVERLGYRLNHGYDESKPDAELDLDDIKKAALFRGGECISTTMKKGDLYTKLKWKCADGHIFEASPYTVLKAGHWCPVCSMPEPWDFDRLSKTNPFFAQIWYDCHAPAENRTYFFDAAHNARYKAWR